MPLSPHTIIAEVATVRFWEAVWQNDWMGMLCLILLALVSVGSLTVIIWKFWVLWTTDLSEKQFREVVDGDGSWDVLFTAAKEHTESPSAHLLREVYVECRLENWFDQKGAISLESRLEVAKSTVQGIISRTIVREEERLMAHLPLLSLSSNLAPMIGLFGTVWGVLAAFQAIGAEGGASISALAPGISTALMTTIFGLFAAIPAVIFYFLLLSKVKSFSVKMEEFSHDIENAVRKQILQMQAAQASRNR
jgi:biopolymer transport protein TolQ